MNAISSSVIGIDPYGYAAAHLSPEAAAVIARLTEVLERDVQPLLNPAWETATMPPGILDALIPLNLMQPDGVSEAEAASSLFAGFRTYVLARADVSVATVYNAQAGLFRAAVRMGGSAEQAARLDPDVRAFRLKGVFALTEPEHGSDVAGGLETTARRVGDEWVLDGTKRWIGGAGVADVLAVFARDADDGEVKLFLVDRQAPGVRIETMAGKVSLRPMQNATIYLEGVRVPEASRLQGVNSWRDVAGILRSLRADIAWIAAGLQAGALEATLRYVNSREQFGRPIGGFQLVQEKLARMLGNLVASLGMAVQLSIRQDAGDFSDENSALAKGWTSLRARETVALAREVLGGNGILIEHDVARFFADAEAVYSYEGTYEINALIVGRGLTGRSAFI